MKNILIVGGGPAGLTQAKALADQGINCEISELAPEDVWGPAGAGIELGGNALRALNSIGLGESVMCRGYKHGLTKFLDHKGNQLCQLDQTALADPPDYPQTIGIVRGALHEGMIAGVREAGVNITCGRTVDHIENLSDVVRVTFSDGAEGEYDLVIGADGIKSRIRQLTFGEISPTYLGYTIIRGHLPRPESLTNWLMYIGTGRRILLNPVSEELVYFGGIFNAPGNPQVTPEETMDMFRNGLRGFGGYVPEIIEAIKTPDQLIYTPVSDLDNDHWVKGRVVLIGDAAHATSPNIAQGAAMAIEDAVLLAEYLGGDLPLNEALDAWYKRRYPRAIWVTRTSRMLGARMQDESSLKAFIRRQVFRWKGSGLMENRQGILKQPM